jgi:hypothetical protein
MGNFCSGGKEESKKAAALQTAEDTDAVFAAGEASSYNNANGLDGLDNSVSGLVGVSSSSAAQQQQQPQDATLQKKPGEAQVKAMREEQNRLDLVVQAAGRGMVSVRSTRGSTGYYDQGFAAALGQHLEQTTKFPDQLPIRLPPFSSNDTNGSNRINGNNSSDPSSSTHTTVFQRLSQPQWEHIALGEKGTGLAGCDGENPNTYMDHVAVSFLDSVVPKKERIFHGGVGPMVENLL